MSGPTAFLRILAGVVQVLQTALPAVPVCANRVRPASQNADRVIVVRLDGTRRAQPGALGAADWQTAIRVECAVRTPAGSEPTTELDALLASAWAAILAAPLALPDVLDLDAEPEIDWDFEAADTPLAMAAFRLIVRHRTQPNTLTPWSA